MKAKTSLIVGLFIIVFPFVRSQAQTGSWSFLTYAKEAYWLGTVVVPTDTVVYIQITDSLRNCCQDFYAFNPNTLTWHKKAPYPGAGFFNLMNFGLNGKVYIGEGRDYSIGNEQHDLWMYEPAKDTWIQKKTMYFGYSTGIGNFGKGFIPMILNNKAYVPMNLGGTVYLMEYNPVRDTWVKKNTVPGFLGVAFTIKNRGYTGLGGFFETTLYEYNPDNNTWDTLHSKFPLSANNTMLSFHTSTRGYVGMVDSGFSYFTHKLLRRFWEYNPVRDTWLAVDSFPSVARPGAFAFGWHDKGYVGMAQLGYNLNDIWEFDPGISSTRESTKANRALQIYPNPACNTLNISYTPLKYECNTQIQLLNMLGQIMEERTVSNNGGSVRIQLNTSHLTAGIYFIKMQTGNQTEVQKVIIE